MTAQGRGRALRFRKRRVTKDLEEDVTLDAKAITSLFDEDHRPLRPSFEDDGFRLSLGGNRHQVGARRGAARGLCLDDEAVLLNGTRLSLVPSEGPLLLGEGRVGVKDENSKESKGEDTSELLHEQPQSNSRPLWNKESIAYF